MMTGLELPRNARDHCQSCTFMRIVGHAHSRLACMRHRSFEKWLSWFILKHSGVILNLPAEMEPLAIRS
eukprot:UN4664